MYRYVETATITVPDALREKATGSIKRYLLRKDGVVPRRMFLTIKMAIEQDHEAGITSEVPMFDAEDIWTPDRTCLVPLERVHKYVTLVGDLCTVWFTSDLARYIVENVHVEWMPQSMRLKETHETEWAFHFFSAYEWEIWDAKVRGNSMIRMDAIHYSFQDVQNILDLKKKRKREQSEEPNEEELARAKTMLRSMTGSENPSEELIEQAQELNETANAVVHASAAFDLYEGVDDYRPSSEPLNAALEVKDENKANALLNSGHNPHTRDDDRYNALHIAAQEGCGLDLFSKILSKFKSKVNAAAGWYKNGYTALMLAVVNNHLDMVVALMQHPFINLNVQNKNKETALYLAVKTNQPIIVAQLLLSNDIDTSLKDITGTTPLSLAICWGYEECASLLRGRSDEEESSSEAVTFASGLQAELAGGSSKKRADITLNSETRLPKKKEPCKNCSRKTYRHFFLNESYKFSLCSKCRIGWPCAEEDEEINIIYMKKACSHFVRLWKDVLKNKKIKLSKQEQFPKLHNKDGFSIPLARFENYLDLTGIRRHILKIWEEKVKPLFHKHPQLRVYDPLKTFNKCCNYALSQKKLKSKYIQDYRKHAHWDDLNASYHSQYWYPDFEFLVKDVTIKEETANAVVRANA